MKNYFRINKLRLIRYSLFISAFFVLSFSIQLFVQKFNINKTILALEYNQKFLSGETYWLKTYYEPFLKTQSAIKIFSHINGVSYQNENIIKITSFYRENKEKNNFTKSIFFNNLNWSNFFYQIFQKFKMMF